jgi:hypothetical protein
MYTYVHTHVYICTYFFFAFSSVATCPGKSAERFRSRFPDRNVLRWVSTIAAKDLEGVSKY